MPVRTPRLPPVRRRTLAPVLALVVLVVLFGLARGDFFGVVNLSLIVQQSLVLGTLALGQALIILTAGVDLACAAVAVLSTLVIAKLAPWAKWNILVAPKMSENPTAVSA